MLRPQFRTLPRMLGSPQTFVDDDKRAKANMPVDFSTDLSTPSHNNTFAAASKVASEEESEITLAIGRFSSHIYAMVIFSYLHVSQNCIVK